MQPLLEVENLRVVFRVPGGERVAVAEANLRIARGECVGLVGESGSGKTQLFMSAMGLLARNGRADGHIRFEAQELLGLPAAALNRVRGSRLTMIFQDPLTALTPHLRIGVQLAEVLVTHAQASWGDARRAAGAMLERVGVPQPQRRMEQYPHELSGGLRQRVMIAMSLLCAPRLLIADEPTSALDLTVQWQIIELLRLLRAELGMAVALVSHDLAVVAELADRIYVMYAGRIVESAPTEQLLHRPRHPYTAELLRCLPRLTGPVAPRMATLAGNAPDAATQPAGCAFAPRCPRAQPRCAAERPLPQGGGAAHFACHQPLPP